MTDDQILRQMGCDIMKLTKERDKYKADADRLAESMKCLIETRDMDERTKEYALANARAALVAHEEGKNG